TSGEAVALRIDGEIVRLPDQIWDDAKIASMLDPITGERERAQFASDNDTDFAYEVPGLARFRINLFRDRHGRGAVFRQIPSVVPSADALGLSDAIRRLCMLSKGLVLVTGPTGS